MSSTCPSSMNLGSNHLGFQKLPNRARNQHFSCNFKVSGLRFGRQKCDFRRNWIGIKAMDEFSDGYSSFDEWEDSDGIGGADILSSDSYILSSSGDESDSEVVVNPIGDVDLPSTNKRFDSSDGALAVTAHRFSMLRRRHTTNRIQPGNIINMGLIAFLVAILLLVDWCSWRIVRLPLASFYLSRPFTISAVSALVAGWLCIPILKKFKIYQTIRKKGPREHYSKKGTPTMGGLFFIPIGITVAGYIAGFSSVEVLGAAAATLAFAAIGLLDDAFSVINKRNIGLPAWIKLMLEVAVGLGFAFWLNSANISSPYSMYSFS